MTLTQLGLVADLIQRASDFATRAQAMVPVRERRLRIVDAQMLGPGNRLAVVAFGGRELLLSVTKQGATLLASDPQ